MVLGSFDSGAGGDERSDLVRATDLATLLEGCLGMGATDIAESASTPLELRSLRHHRPELRQRVSEVLSSQKVRASGIIAENQSLVEKLAAHLIEVRSVTGIELSHFFRQHKCALATPDSCSEGATNEVLSRS